MHILTLSPETTMLLLSLIMACADEAPEAAAPTRKHHAAVPVSPKEAAEAVEDEGPPVMGSGDREPFVRSVRIKPAEPTRLDTLEIDVDAVDPDRKRIELTYEWSVNGVRVYGVNKPALPLEDHARGDVVSVVVTASDGTHQVEVKSDPYTIVNANPQFEGKPTEMKKIEGTRLEATDPDGDTVTFTLSGAPTGLTLDSRGVLHYAGSETEPGGKYTLKIVAEDGHGGAATLELPLTLTAGSKAVPGATTPG